MDLNQKVIAALIGVFLLIALLRILRTPLKLALKLLINTLAGFVALWFVTLTAPVTGLHLGMNLINALIIAVFGVPGLVLLLLLQWIL